MGYGPGSARFREGKKSKWRIIIKPTVTKIAIPGEKEGTMSCSSPRKGHCGCKKKKKKKKEYLYMDVMGWTQR